MAAKSFAASFLGRRSAPSASGNKPTSTFTHSILSKKEKCGRSGKFAEEHRERAMQVVHRTKAQRESIPVNVSLREKVVARCATKIKWRVRRRQAKRGRAEHLVECREPGKKRAKHLPLTELHSKRSFYRRHGRIGKRNFKGPVQRCTPTWMKQKKFKRKELKNFWRKTEKSAIYGRRTQRGNNS